MTKGHAGDPEGLIGDDFSMEGIGSAECRSIFPDRAPGLPPGQETGPALKRLHVTHGGGPPTQPMTQGLTEGTMDMQTPRRRAGWRSRTGN